MESSIGKISKTEIRITELRTELNQINIEISKNQNLVSFGTETPQEFRTRQELVAFFNKRKKEVEEELEKLLKDK